MKLFFVFIISGTLVSCEVEETRAMVRSSVEYSDTNFKTSVEKGPHFIMFFAPWCGHSRKFAPTWEDLANIVNAEWPKEATIARVDCTLYYRLCEDQGVSGYPTLKFFKGGAEKEDGVKYSGMKRNVESMRKFIKDQLEVKEVIARDGVVWSSGKKVNCWNECGNEGDFFCPVVCGENGWCCRKDFSGDNCPDQAREASTSGYHSCVIKSVEEATDEYDIDFGEFKDLDFVNKLQGVSCGGHSAEDCSKCVPLGEGANFCNGDCTWINDNCILASLQSSLFELAIPLLRHAFDFSFPPSPRIEPASQGAKFPRCVTVGGAETGATCVFPFTFGGKTFRECTHDVAELWQIDGKYWCSTLVDDEGVHVAGKGKWGHCAEGCPGVPSKFVESSTRATSTLDPATVSSRDCVKENNIDYKGYDISGSVGVTTAKNVDECAEACRRNDKCKFWTYGDYCWMKYAKSGSRFKRVKYGVISGNKACDKGDCITISGPGAGSPCIFPFTFNGNTYNSCTTDGDASADGDDDDGDDDDSGDGGADSLVPWCSTKVNSQGNHIGGYWGRCQGYCGLSTTTPRDTSTTESTTTVRGSHQGEGEWTAAVWLNDDSTQIVKNVGEQAFNALFAKCPVVQYTRNGAVHSVYIRTSPIPPSFNAFSAFTHNWISANNELNADFRLYDHLEDAKNDRGAWHFCNYVDLKTCSVCPGYPRDCGKSGRVNHRWFRMPNRGKSSGITSGIGFDIYTGSMCTSPLDEKAIDGEALHVKTQEGRNIPKVVIIIIVLPLAAIMIFILYTVARKFGVCGKERSYAESDSPAGRESYRWRGSSYHPSTAPISGDPMSELPLHPPPYSEVVGYPEEEPPKYSDIMSQSSDIPWAATAKMNGGATT